jgi:hypothetical protein
VYYGKYAAVDEEDFGQVIITQEGLWTSVGLFMVRVMPTMPRWFTKVPRCPLVCAYERLLVQSIRTRLPTHLPTNPPTTPACSTRATVFEPHPANPPLSIHRRSRGYSHSPYSTPVKAYSGVAVEGEGRGVVCKLSATHRAPPRPTDLRALSAGHGPARLRARKISKAGPIIKRTPGVAWLFLWLFLGLSGAWVPGASSCGQLGVSAGRC